MPSNLARQIVALVLAEAGVPSNTEVRELAAENVDALLSPSDAEQLMELRRVYEEMHVFVSAAAEQGCLRSRRVHCAENEPDSANWCLPCQAKFLILEASHEKEQRAKSV